MSKPILMIIGIMVVTFGAGVGLGLFLGGGLLVTSGPEQAAGSTSSGPFSDAEVQDREQSNVLLSNRIRELEKALADQKKAQDSISTGRIAFFKKYHDQLRITPLDGDTKVSSEMAEILGLSKEEQEAVNHHLKETSDEINKIENDSEFVAKQNANGFTIETPENPNGKAIKDALTDSLSADIGGDRAAFLMSYMEDSSGGPFSGFGEQKKDLEINWAEQNGKESYTIKNDFFGPGGTYSSWTTTPTLPSQYKKYLQTDASQ